MYSSNKNATSLVASLAPCARPPGGLVEERVERDTQGYVSRFCWKRRPRRLRRCVLHAAWVCVGGGVEGWGGDWRGSPAHFDFGRQRLAWGCDFWKSCIGGQILRNAGALSHCKNTGAHVARSSEEAELNNTARGIVEGSCVANAIRKFAGEDRCTNLSEDASACKGILLRLGVGEGKPSITTQL